MANKINLIIRLQHWMDSVPGQTFLNYAYSWGASIVILGALFKLTHLPGGNLMLFIGMGTEVVVFFLSAFDRPFDRQEIGKELPKTYLTDDEIAERMAAENGEAYYPEEEEPLTDDQAYQPDTTEEEAEEEDGETETPAAPQPVAPQPVYITTSPQPAAAAATPQPAPAPAPAAEASAPAPAAEGTPVPADATAAQLAQIIRQANDELLHRAQVVLSPEMEQATTDYIEKLKTLNDTLAKVDEQNMRLTRDSEEMENLNRTLTGINKVYELHLKSISLQVGTIDDINAQTKKLAEQIQRLNQVYGRMIDALTVNMGRQAAPVAPAPDAAE